MLFRSLALRRVAVDLVVVGLALLSVAVDFVVVGSVLQQVNRRRSNSEWFRMDPVSKLVEAG